MQPTNSQNKIKKVINRLNPNPPRKWVNIITRFRENLMEEIEVDLNTKIVDSEACIIVPKEIVNYKEDRKNITLIGRFVGIKLGLKAIQNGHLKIG